MISRVFLLEFLIEVLKEINYGFGVECESFCYCNMRFYDRVIEYEEKFEVGNYDIVCIKIDIKYVNDEIKCFFVKFYIELSVIENFERVLKQFCFEKEVVEVVVVRFKVKMVVRDGLLIVLFESLMRFVRLVSVVSYYSIVFL